MAALAHENDVADDFIAAFLLDAAREEKIDKSLVVLSFSDKNMDIVWKDEITHLFWYCGIYKREDC